MSTIKSYQDLKEKYPEHIILMRTAAGFYVAYDHDARVVAEVTGVTLICSVKEHQAMFPIHALDTYLPKIVRAGKRVAICDELPKVEELITPYKKEQ